MRVREAAPAKVNLFLHVTGRRADGYHLLDSLAVFAEVADQIEARPGSGLALATDGPQSAPLLLADAPDNLVLRAARALAEASGAAAGARLRLHKVLPVASGIGGGSADAAATLRVLARLWGLPVPPELAGRLARALGADVPVCLACRPARMRGIGDELLPAPALPGFGLLLVNPGVAVSTAAVFRARDALFSAPALLPGQWRDAAAMAADLARFGNDLEVPARALCPPVAWALAALAALPGCLLARMSGSGATCFGLFASPEAARLAAGTMHRPPGWWVWGGGPHTPSGNVAGAAEIEAAAWPAYAAGPRWGVAKR